MEEGRAKVVEIFNSDDEEKKARVARLVVDYLGELKAAFGLEELSMHDFLAYMLMVRLRASGTLNLEDTPPN